MRGTGGESTKEVWCSDAVGSIFSQGRIESHCAIHSVETVQAKHAGKLDRNKNIRKFQECQVSSKNHDIVTSDKFYFPVTITPFSFGNESMNFKSKPRCAFTSSWGVNASHCLREISWKTPGSKSQYRP